MFWMFEKCSWIEDFNFCLLDGSGQCKWVLFLSSLHVNFWKSDWGYFIYQKMAFNRTTGRSVNLKRNVNVNVTEIGFFTRDFSYTCDTWDSLMYFWQKVTAMGMGATIIQTKSVLRKICQYKREVRQIYSWWWKWVQFRWFWFWILLQLLLRSKQGNASMPPV